MAQKNQDQNRIFHRPFPLGRVGHRVAMSVCMCVRFLSFFINLCLAVWVCIKQCSENMVQVVLLQIAAKDFTVIHTYGHGDSMTDPAQRAELVKKL